MALYWKSLDAVTFMSSYTSSTTVNLDTLGDGKAVSIATFIRGNNGVWFGSPPTYAGVPYTLCNGPLSATWYGYAQLGMSSSIADATLKIYYLMNPQTGSNDFVVYQGVQGDAATLQNLHCILVTVTASLGAGIELETSTGSHDSTPVNGVTPTIISSASVGSFALATMVHNDPNIQSAKNNWQEVTKSDFGSYCGYWQNTIVTASALPTEFSWKLNSSSPYSVMFLSFREVWPDKTSYVTFLDDEAPTY